MEVMHVNVKSIEVRVGFGLKFHLDGLKSISAQEGSKHNRLINNL